MTNIPRDDALRAIAEELYHLYDGRDSITLSEEHRRAATFAHGWYTAVRRTGRAVLLLADDGYEHEAAPLRRSMLEHALALHWLSDAPTGAVDSLLRAHQLWAEKVKESAASGWSVPIEVVDSILAVDVAASPEDSYLNFKQRCDRYGAGDLYLAWLTECSFSHPSFSSAAAYADQDARGDLVLLPEALKAPKGSGGIVATVLLIASQGFQKLLVGEPWSAQLKDIETRLAKALGPS